MRRRYKLESSEIKQFVEPPAWGVYIPEAFVSKLLTKVLNDIN